MLNDFFNLIDQYHVQHDMSGVPLYRAIQNIRRESADLITLSKSTAELKPS